MFLVKRIIMIMCVKNHKSEFKFVEVIFLNVDFFSDTVYIHCVTSNTQESKLCFSNVRLLNKFFTSYSLKLLFTIFNVCFMFSLKYLGSSSRSRNRL